MLAVGVAACADGGTTEGAASPRPTTASATPPPLVGDPILIQTRVIDARSHTGEVLAGSVLGDDAFCAKGTTSGFSRGPTITTRFNCAEGTLTVAFTPSSPTRVQGGPWNVVSGTGSFAGLRGGGSVVAVFDSDGADTGREVFAGQVGR